MKNTLNKIPKKLWIPAAILSVLSIIPMYYIYTYIMDMTKLGQFNTIGAVQVDEIMSRNIHEIKFLLPCVFISLIMVAQGVLSALIIKNYKGWQNKGFAITNLFFGGIIISNIFLLLKLIKTTKTTTIVKVSSVGVGTVATLAVPTAIFAVSMGVGSIDNPTHLENIVMSDKDGEENVLEIFTDGFDPIKALPYFQNDPLFKDFISMDRMVTGGYTTEPSYTEMMGGITRNPYFLKRELDKKEGFSPVKGLDTESWSAYLHENFMDTALNRARANGFDHSYMGNPDDDGHFSNYFQHVSGDPQKLEDRYKVMNKEQKLTGDKAKKLDVYNWGQAKDETATAGVSTYQNNVAVYKWMEQNIKVTHDGKGTRIFLQDSITHAPRVIGKNGGLSFSAVADSASLNQAVAFSALHKVLHDLIAAIPEKTFDNTLISIYGDHSDHSNPIPNAAQKNPIYIKNWGEAIIKYPHVKNADQNATKMVSNKTAFYAPNMGDLISDYFNDKTRFNGKTSAQVNDLISKDLKSHVQNYNHFVTLEASDKHQGAFVTFKDIATDHAKLVPYIPDALDDKTLKARKETKHLQGEDNPNGNWMDYEDFINIPELEPEILGMGWL